MIDPQSIFQILNRPNASHDESFDSGLNFFLNPTHSFSSTLNNTSKQPALSKLQSFLQSKIHISLLVIFTYGLIVTGIWPTDNVFLLFLLWELAEIFVLRTYEVKHTSIFSMLFLLAGIPPAHSTVVLKWFELVNKVLRDVAIFVFFFVCVHIFWELLVAGRALNVILHTESTHI